MDVQRGGISADSPGGDGGGDEHSGSLSGVRPAPGHGAQDAGLLCPAGLSAADSTPEAQPFDKLRTIPSPASSTVSWMMITAFRRSSATPPSASTSVSGTSTASMAGTPSSRTTSGSIDARHGRCSCRCPTRQATPSATSARQWWSSRAWSRRLTASSSTCPTATAASSRPIPQRPPRPSWTATCRPSPSWAVCPEHRLRQYQAGGGQDTGRRTAPAHPRLH